jgi:cell division protein FtsA
VSRVEKQCDVWLTPIFLAMSGRHISGTEHEGVVRVGGVGCRVSPNDVVNALGLSKAKDLQDGRCLVHHLPGGFHLDGVAVANPVGREGKMLRAPAWLVDADSSRVSDILCQLTSLGLRVEQIVLGGLASAAAVTSSDERQEGVLVLDFGAGLIDYALYHRGFPVSAGTVAAGGDHVTRDLAVAFRLSMKEAEVVKRLFGRADIRASRDDQVWLTDTRGVGARPASRLAVEQVVAARVQESLNLVRRKLGPLHVAAEIRAGVVITGGLSALPGAVEVAERIFDAPARLGAPDQSVGPQLQDPGFSTVVGTLLEGMRLQLTHPRVPSPPLARRFLRAADYVLRPGDDACTLPPRDLARSYRD